MFKKMKWMLLASGLSLSLLASTSASAAVAFTDVSSNYWAKPHIERLSDIGAIQGFPDGTFGINKKVTRAQASKMLVIGLGLEDQLITNKSSFKDVSDKHWAKPYIETLAAHNIIGGFPDGTFKPNDNLTRGQMAGVISDGFKIKNTSSVSFKDIHSKQWFSQAVNALATASVTTGYEDGTFRPAENISRAHMAVFISKGMDADQRGEKPEEKPEKPTPPVIKPEVKPEPKPEPKPEASPDVDLEDLNSLDFTIVNVVKSGTNVEVELAVEPAALQDTAQLLKFGAAYAQETLRLNTGMKNVKITFYEATANGVNKKSSKVWQNNKVN